MNRKEIPVTIALSFDVEDGIFDIRHTFDTESWKEIDDFVQQNFLKKNLNKFNSRITVEPEHIPTDSKSSRKKQPATSSRTARERQTGPAARVKPTEEKNTKTNPKEHKKETGNKKQNGAKNQTKKVQIGKNKENKENPVIEGVQGKEKDNGKPKGETSKAKKLPVNRGKRNASTVSAKKQEIATPLNNSMEKVVSPEKTPMTTNEIKIEPEVDYSMPDVNTSINVNSTASFPTSASENEKSPINNSLGKEAVIAKDNIAAPKGDASAKHCEKGKKKKMLEKCETKAVTSGTINKLETSESYVASGGAKSCKQTKTPKCAKSVSEKIATTESKKVGKFEQRLLEKQDRHTKKTLRKQEKKAERAMEQFSYHVIRIAQEMNYLPDDSSKDDLDNDCCNNSSAESSYSDSCCSNSSCSCCTSYSSFSSEYSEYTLGSSSD